MTPKDFYIILAFNLLTMSVPGEGYCGTRRAH